jgi:hypothetical protein
MNAKDFKKQFDILGYPVTEKVTGFKGIATSICFDLYGCVQILVNPGLGPDKKQLDCHWFDISRLKVTGKPVMKAPDFFSSFGDKGPESNKPVQE